MSIFNYAVLEWPHFSAHVPARAQRLSGFVVVFDGPRVVAASASLPDWQPDMPLGRARRLYPFASFIRRDRAREDAAHAVLERRLVSFSPRIETLSLGRFLLQGPDVDGIADFITQRPVLRGAAAPTAEWARLAVCTARAGTLRLVYDAARFLQETETAVLAPADGPLGTQGRDVAHRLNLFGLPYLGDVAHRLSRRHLRVQFGPALGASIDRLLRPGRQPSVPFYQAPRELSATWELDQPSPLGAPWVASGTQRLAARLAETLRGLAAHAVSLQAFVPGRGTLSEGYLASRGLWSETDLARLTERLYHRLGLAAGPTAEVLSLNLSARKLTAQAAVQANLFSPRTEPPALTRAVRLLQQRYGERAVLRARPVASLFVERRHAMIPAGSPA